MRRRVNTPPGVPVVAAPELAVRFYREMLDIAYAEERDSRDVLLADLFAEGVRAGAAAARPLATAVLERERAELSLCLDMAARQVERRNEWIRRLQAQVRELGGVPVAAPETEPSRAPAAATPAPRELTYTTEGAQA